MCDYEVLSPWAETDPVPPKGLNPRLNDLMDKKIGLFAGFKEHWPLILEEVGCQLKERYPRIKLSPYQYVKDTTEIEKDREFRSSLENWLLDVDAVISGYGDGVSCALYLAYNTAFIEKLGKPAVLLTTKQFLNVAKSGAASRHVPLLRIVATENLPDFSFSFSLEGVKEKHVRPVIATFLDDIIAALTKPLTPEEAAPRMKAVPSGKVFKGTLEEVNIFFYKNGWSYGMPIMPPTREAVNEMLKGTDLPSDYIVARIPPRMGRATVEKIAINAVMAGCLPTYMPIIIAAVEAITDPDFFGGFGRALEGYTNSTASWAPMIIVNGPIRQYLNISSGVSFLTPFNKANASIGHALGLILMNIGGSRPGLENMSVFGHEGGLGICIAENEEESPWEPLHTTYGFKKEENVVTIVWPNSRQVIIPPPDAAGILRKMCDDYVPFGFFDPYCTYILNPPSAKILADEGWTKKDVVRYLLEYARIPASEVNVRWIKGNRHTWQLKGTPLPAEGTRSFRKFWTEESITIVVGGAFYAPFIAAYGGASHGSRSYKKIELPPNWNELVEKYEHVKATYLPYY